MTEAVVIVVMATVWWVPTFMGLADLQRRTGVRRVLVWKWTAILCVPVFGAWLYSRRGKDELTADERSRRGPAR